MQSLSIFLGVSILAGAGILANATGDEDTRAALIDFIQLTLKAKQVEQKFE